MKVTIQSIHFDADRKLTSFVSSKCGKLSHFFDAIVDTQVFLRLDRNSSGENKVVSLKVLVPGTTLQAEQQGSTFEEATDLCLDQMKRQVKKYKERLRASQGASFKASDTLGGES